MLSNGCNKEERERLRGKQRDRKTINLKKEKKTT